MAFRSTSMTATAVHPCSAPSSALAAMLLHVTVLLYSVVGLLSLFAPTQQLGIVTTTRGAQGMARRIARWQLSVAGSYGFCGCQVPAAFVAASPNPLVLLPKHCFSHPTLTTAFYWQVLTPMAASRTLPDRLLSAKDRSVVFGSAGSVAHQHTPLWIVLCPWHTP